MTERSFDASLRAETSESGVEEFFVESEANKKYPKPIPSISTALVQKNSLCYYIRIYMNNNLAELRNLVNINNQDLDIILENINNAEEGIQLLDYIHSLGIPKDKVEKINK